MISSAERFNHGRSPSARHSPSLGRAQSVLACKCQRHRFRTGSAPRPPSPPLRLSWEADSRHYGGEGPVLCQRSPRVPLCPPLPPPYNKPRRIRYLGGGRILHFVRNPPPPSPSTTHRRSAFVPWDGLNVRDGDGRARRWLTPRLSPVFGCALNLLELPLGLIRFLPIRFLPPFPPLPPPLQNFCINILYIKLSDFWFFSPKPESRLLILTIVYISVFIALRKIYIWKMMGLQIAIC